MKQTFDLSKALKAIKNKKPVSKIPKAKKGREKGSGDWTKFLFSLDHNIPITANDIGTNDNCIQSAMHNHKKHDSTFKYRSVTINEVLTFFKTEGKVKKAG